MKDEQEIQIDSIIQEAMNAAQIAWWQVELPSKKITCAPNERILAGFKPEDVATYDDWLQMMDPADRKPTEKALLDHVNGEAKLYESLYRIKAFDGEEITFYDRGKVVQREGDYVRVVGFITNVSAFEKFIYNISNQPYIPIEREETS